MIVECSSCHTKYNVDENKIPPTGVRVRCRKCQNIIFIKKEEPTPQPTAPEIPTAPPKPEQPYPPEPQRPPEPTAPTEAAVPEAERPKPPPEGLSEEDKKWHERAKRLAKALASDLVLYNQDKVEKGIREGTLVQLLGSEIRRSWDYYCQQIPKHIVQSTDYFKEQLNRIVGKGREIFK